MTPQSYAPDEDCKRCDGTGYDAQRVMCSCVSLPPEPVERVELPPPGPTEFTLEGGKHAGEPLTRVPASYLRWMVNEGHQYADFAEAELKRRGTAVPAVELTPHALDRASLRLLDVWQRTRFKKEGLHTWLGRMAERALENRDAGDGRYMHMGCIFIFSMIGRWPVLKSVWVKGRSDDDEERTEGHAS